MIAIYNSKRNKTANGENKMMNIEYKLGWRWIVWVGGVDDYFLNYEDAKESYDEWIDAGYDFVKIEEIVQ